MYKFLVSILSMLLLAGCATTANYQRIVNQWQGAKATDLVNTWGYPESSVKLPNGNTVYMYSRQQLYSTPTPLYPAPAFNYLGAPGFSTGFVGTPYYSTQTTSLYCRTWFEANPRGIIVNTQFQGNNCIASNPNQLVP